MAFEALRVYQAARLLDAEIRSLIQIIPRGHGDDVDHLKRAVASILYNVPEADGSISTGRRRYHLDVARGSSDEVRAVLRRLVDAGALAANKIVRSCGLTSVIAKMLTAMIRALPPE